MEEGSEIASYAWCVIYNDMSSALDGGSLYKKMILRHWNTYLFQQSNAIPSSRKPMIMPSRTPKQVTIVMPEKLENLFMSSPHYWASCWSALPDHLPIVVEDLPFVVMNWLTLIYHQISNSTRGPLSSRYLQNVLRDVLIHLRNIHVKQVSLMYQSTFCDYAECTSLIM